MTMRSVVQCGCCLAEVEDEESVVEIADANAGWEELSESGRRGGQIMIIKGKNDGSCAKSVYCAFIQPQRVAFTFCWEWDGE